MTVHWFGDFQEDMVVAFATSWTILLVVSSGPSNARRQPRDSRSLSRAALMQILSAYGAFRVED